MAFTATPLLPGDLFDSAARFAADAEARLAPLPDPGSRGPLLLALWEEMTALGWPAVAIAEEAGGAGAGLEGLAAIVEGAGRAALPLPLAACCGVVPALLEGESALDAIAEGTWRVAPAFASMDRDPGDGPARATLRNGALHLSGRLIGVEQPPGATHHLLVLPVDDEAGLVLAPTEALVPRLHERLDGRVAADLSLDGVVLPASALVVRGEVAARRAAAAGDLGALLTCVEAVAAMGALLEGTIAYLSARTQFGETLSRFQVLRHRTVEVYTVLESARAMVADLLEGAIAAEGGAAFPHRALHLAKLHLGEASREVAAAAVQLHGGMGLTEELPASRLVKRLFGIEFDYGDAAHHAAALAA